MPLRLIASVILISLSIATSLFGAGFEVAGSLYPSHMGSVKLAQYEGLPVLYFQASARDIHVLKPGGTATRVPVYGSILVDVQEDNSQLLCLHDPNIGYSSSSLPKSFYLTSPAGGPWAQVEAPTGTTQPFRALGLTPGGKVFGRASDSNQNSFWVRHTAGDFTEHSWVGAGGVVSVGAEGKVLVSNERWWTAAQGEKEIPGGYKSDRISATSANGRWLVSFEADTPHTSMHRLVRWPVSETGDLGLPVYQILPGPLEATSFARVLDNGTAFVTAAENSSSTAFGFMDVFVWHANGVIERLADALAKNEAINIPADWTVMGRVFDVTPDGKAIAGAREKPESNSVNEMSEVWLASLDAPLLPPPPSSALRVRTRVNSMSFSVQIANEGAAPLRLVSAELAGPDAGLMNLQDSNPAFPLDLPPGEGITLTVGFGIIQRDVLAELQLTTDIPSLPLHVEALAAESSQMPQILLGTPRLQTGTTDSDIAVDLALGRPVPFEMNVANLSEAAATGCLVEIQAPAGLVFTPSSFPAFDLAAKGSHTLSFTVTANQAGDFIPAFNMQPQPGFRVIKQTSLLMRGVAPHEIRWVSADGATPYDSQTQVLDFGDIPVGGTGRSEIHVAYQPNGGRMTLYTRNSLNAEVHAYAYSPHTISSVPTMESWRNVTFSSKPGRIAQQVAVSPKTTGIKETVVSFDAPGAASPVNLKIRCNGIAAPALFLTQPHSAILIASEGVTVQARAVGFSGLVDTNGNTPLRSSAPDVYSYAPEPGSHQLRLTFTGGELLSQEFQIGRLYGNGSSAQQTFKPGGTVFLSAPQSSPGMRHEWLKDGSVLAASNRVQFAPKNWSVTLKKLQPADAGEYACRYFLETPTGEISRTIFIATVVQEPAIVPPQITPFSLRKAREGEFLQFSFSSSQPTDKFTVTGLPPGLKYKDGLVTGFVAQSAAAKEPKTYVVKVRGIYKGVAGPVYEAPWIIEPFADTWLAGTYHGVVERDGAYPQGAAVKISLNASGTGSFSISGPLTQADRGAILLAGRGPEDVPSAFDPPLPTGLGQPQAAATLIGIGRILRGQQPLVLSLAPVGENMLTGTLGNAQNPLGPPVLALRQIPPSRELQSKGAAPFSVHLKIPENQWIWKKHPAWTDAAGTSGHALTFTDSSGRLHLLGSRLPAVSGSDHWVWDMEALQWVSAESAGMTQAESPKPGAKEGQVTWQTAAGGDFWTLTPQGGLWKWNSGAGGWHLVLEDLPQGSSGSWGEIGVPHASNRPRGRINATTWTTADGNLWLFGGDGLSDLWRFQPQTGLWTWMAGRASLPTEEADWRSDGILEPGSGNGPGWVGKDGRLYLHQGLQNEDCLWAFDPGQGLWTREYTSTGIRVQPGFASSTDRVVEDPSTGTSPGERTPQAFTWTGENGHLYLFGGAIHSSAFSNFEYTDFYIWHYEPENHRWVCDGYAAGGLDTGNFGFMHAQKWLLPDGRFFLRGARRYEDLNQQNSYATSLHEFGPHPVQNTVGFLSLQIAANGTVKWTGRLPDNEVVTGSGGLSKVTEEVLPLPGFGGNWVSGFYATLGRKTHTAQGLLAFSEREQECRVLIDWNRPEATSVANQRILPGGFPVTLLGGQGWRHSPTTWKERLPPDAIQLAAFLDLPANTLKFGLDSRQRFTATLGNAWTPDKLKVAYAPATGLVTLSGTIPDPSDTKKLRPWNLQGLLIPHNQSAAGLFTLPAPLDATFVPMPAKQANSTQIHLRGFEAAPSP